MTLPSGEALTAGIYIDHNLGTAVKDAFVLPETLQDLLARVTSSMDNPQDQQLALTDTATARAIIEAAIEHGASFLPPLESDTWPAAHPLVEWMLRMLPGGGAMPAMRDWSRAEVDAVIDDFLASPAAAGLDDKEDASLASLLVDFATSYIDDDPYRWSPTVVEIMLLDWFSRKVMAPVDYLAKMPAVLRAFIRYAHAERKIRPGLTQLTLAAVDKAMPAFTEAIGAGRGPSRRSGSSDPWGDGGRDVAAGFDSDQFYLNLLGTEVGGADALATLDTAPLPDEEFDWEGIADDIHPVLQEILDACDSCVESFLDLEQRTAMRRLLARAARNDPKVFRRRSSPLRAAAAIAWIIASANHSLNAPGGRSTKELLAHFGVTGGVSDRVMTLLVAAGIETSLRGLGQQGLGDPGLLGSPRRTWLVAERDQILLPQAAQPVGN